MLLIGYMIEFKPESIYYQACIFYVKKETNRENTKIITRNVINHEHFSDWISGFR